MKDMRSWIGQLREVGLPGTISKPVDPRTQKDFEFERLEPMGAGSVRLGDFIND